MNEVLKDIHLIFYRMYDEIPLDQCQMMFEEFVHTPQELSPLLIVRAKLGLALTSYRREKFKLVFYELGGNQEEGIPIVDEMLKNEREYTDFVEELREMNTPLEIE